jgi:hypothetical protein
MRGLLTSQPTSGRDDSDLLIFGELLWSQHANPSAAGVELDEAQGGSTPIPLPQVPSSKRPRAATRCLLWFISWPYIVGRRGARPTHWRPPTRVGRAADPLEAWPARLPPPPSGLALGRPVPSSSASAYSETGIDEGMRGQRPGDREQRRDRGEGALDMAWRQWGEGWRQWGSGEAVGTAALGCVWIGPGMCLVFFFRTAVRRVGLKMIRVELDHCGVSELLKIPI